MSKRKAFTFSDFVRLCRDADDLIKEVNSKSHYFKHLKPTSKKAAAIHYLARKRNLPVRVFDLYFIYTTLQKTISRAKKEIIKTLETKP